MAGKYIVSLGDSTMTETVYDMIMLMAGLGTNQTALNAFVRNATRCVDPGFNIAISWQFFMSFVNRDHLVAQESPMLDSHSVLPDASDRLPFHVCKSG